jgi:folate-binding protein YgfZ
MLKDTMETRTTTALPALGAIRALGPDAVKFLQGQVSNDVALLRPGESQLAGLHNPQGRVIALLQLVMITPDEVLAILPRELAAPATARLSKYTLRAKVKITDASSEDWPSRLPAAARSAIERSSGGTLAAIAAGLPQVYAATSEQFVAQMINLDVLGGISFTKGCYTGQEVIARAHYRGRVKRRMQRFRTATAATLAPGDAGKLKDGRSFRVVDATTLPDGRCEFLAVAPLVAGQLEAGLEPGQVEQDAAADAGAATSALDAEQLTLPYELPA